MEQNSRRVTISLETFIKRSWPVLAFGAVLLIGAIAGLTWFAVSGKGRKQPVVETVTATSTVAEAATSTSDLVSRALDGVLVLPAESRLQSYAVMVENHTDARPLSGPAAANLAFEIPVEGGITRYLLVFDATTTVDAIGPVRSARSYYVDLADGLNAVYAHVGGSPESLDMIKGMSGFRDLNEFSNGKYFWRSTKRVAPHSTYTRTDLLHEAAAAKNFKEGHFVGWHYKDDDALESTTSSVRGKEDGPKLKYGGSYNTSWSYNREENVYERYEAKSLQKDADGTVVKAKNVVVLSTDGQVLDNVGRLKIRTTGRGNAVLYRDGKMMKIVWRRTAGENFRFEGLDGTDVMFNRGTTWVEVTLDSGTFDSTEFSATSTAK
ncbi:DUF3048 domain-containing protein [Candidatus Uhrbacteria bacterium]|nr:DUF3048 domain-containing protein [Candidatus Uhrbacteria bacterium]